MGKTALESYGEQTYILSIVQVHPALVIPALIYDMSHIDWYIWVNGPSLKGLPLDCPKGCGDHYLNIALT